jgi:hypothetical protein
LFDVLIATKREACLSKNQVEPHDSQHSDSWQNYARRHVQHAAPVAGSENPRMNWTKLSGVARATMVAALIAAPALAGVVLLVGPALPGHVVAPWVSAQPHIQAIGGADPCAIAARRYRDDLNYVPPAGCWKTAWLQGSDGHWRIQLPGDWHSQRQPPGAPGDAPPPPGETP